MESSEPAYAVVVCLHTRYVVASVVFPAYATRRKLCSATQMRMVAGVTDVCEWCARDMALTMWMARCVSYGRYPPPVKAPLFRGTFLRCCPQSSHYERIRPCTLIRFRVVLTVAAIRRHRASSSSRPGAQTTQYSPGCI